MVTPTEAHPYDLVVVGGGIAGLTGALCAATTGRVLLLTKSAPPSSASSWLAQGGIAAAIGSDDDPRLHAEDTLKAGRGLCSARAVEVLTSEAPARVVDLVEMGIQFDDDLGLEGGHGRRRILHAGGASTGRVVADALAERALSHPQIDTLPETRVLALWKSEGRCVGVVTPDGPIQARATMLATGGMAALWARTTNPSGTVGDGAVLAFRAGAALADLEFTQFHPTVLASNGLLLTEALRGEGATLLDGRGQRFVDELAPRDVVARAIGREGTALLDLRDIDRSRFPSLIARIEEEGIDPAVEPIPVAPAAHYTMGGIVTDVDGHTGVPGLFAAGECACTGVHGANRLASNSLLECLVFGRRAAIAADAEPQVPRPAAPAMDEPLPPVTADLRAALWADAGLTRDAEGLRRIAALPHPLAALIGSSALAREESRGGHFRLDHPRERAELARHLVHRQGQPPLWEDWA